MSKKLVIKLEEWDHTCGDGCCYNYGTKILLNGEELEHPESDDISNLYIGDSVELSLWAVLKKLGYEVEFER
jgi:hypothetical protein